MLIDLLFLIRHICPTNQREDHQCTWQMICSCGFTVLQHSLMRMKKKRHSGDVPLGSLPFMAVAWASWAEKQSKHMNDIHIPWKKGNWECCYWDVIYSAITDSGMCRQKRDGFHKCNFYLEKLQLIECQVFDWHLDELQILVVFLWKQKKKHIYQPGKKAQWTDLDLYSDSVPSW